MDIHSLFRKAPLCSLSTGIGVLWGQIVGDLCSGSRRTSCPVGRRSRAVPAPRHCQGGCREGQLQEGFPGCSIPAAGRALASSASQNLWCLGNGERAASEGAVFAPERRIPIPWAAQQKVPVQSPSGGVQK